MIAKSKIIIGIFIFLIVFSGFGVFVSAEDFVPDGYEDFLESLPDSTADKLPNGIKSDNVSDIADAVSEMTGIEYILSALISSFGDGIVQVIPHVSVLMGIIVLSALYSLICTHIFPSGASVLDLCSHFAVFAVIGGIAVTILDDVREFFSALHITIGAFIPLSTALYTMGGNVGTAVKNVTGLSVTLGITEVLSSIIVVPLFCFCLATSLISISFGDFGGVSFGATVKKIFMTILGVIVAVLSLSLSSQTIISAKADTLTMKGAKVFLGSIPISGGAVSSGLGTIASSISLIRGSVGIGGIIIICLLLLPTLIEIWLMKIIYSVMSGFCSVLGVSSGCQKLLSDISELYGILEGVVIMCSSVFIVSMAVLCSVAPAIA